MDGNSGKSDANRGGRQRGIEALFTFHYAPIALRAACCVLRLKLCDSDLPFVIDIDMDEFQLLVALLLLLLPLLLVKLSRRSRTAIMLDKIPGPRAYPIVGNLLEQFQSREQSMRRIVHREKLYSPIYRTWLGSIPVVHISSPESFEAILNSSKHLKKGFAYKFLQPWLGNGLLTSDGRKWHEHRKMITPTFHFRILETFLDVFHENSEILVNKLKAKAECGEVVDVYPFITLCALDIICETAMGTKVYAQNKSLSTYVTAVCRLTHLTARRCLKLWMHPDYIYYRSPEGKEYTQQLAVVHGFTDKIILERKEARRRRKLSVIPQEEIEIGRTKKRRAFLDLLLEASGDEEDAKLTDVELRDEVDTFMFEGHDTSTAAMSWAIMLLGLHRDVQEQAYQELRQIFRDDRRRAPSMRDLSEMKYLERIIKEALRLYPSVPVVARLLEEDTECGGYIVPKGSTIVLHIYNIHRNPTIYPEPDKFDPNRFLPENTQHRHPYAYVPFSAGARNCVGQKFALLEEKVILSMLLRNYKIETVEDPEKLILINELILRPGSGIRVKLSLRP